MMPNWSISKINSLRRCNRQYYFGQVAANHGRKDSFRREAYELKRMQNLKMWPGSVVDMFIENEIIPNVVNLKSIDFSKLAEDAVSMARSQYDFSKNKLYEDPSIRMGDVRTQFAILSIHKLNQEYSQIDLEEVYDKIRTSILNFPTIPLAMFDCDLLEFLKRTTWRLPNAMNWAFDIDGVRVSPQIDLITFYNNKPVIIDWKVAQSFTSDYSRQLIICGLSVLNWQKKKSVESRNPLPKMADYTLLEVNLLGQNNVKEHDFTLERANEIIDYINLTGSDVELLLSGRKYGDIDIHEFDLTDKDTTCSFCNFKSLCEQTLTKNYIGYEEKAHN